MDAIPSSPQVTLITGGSSGLGQAFAVDLARQGGCIALLARQPDRLQAVAAELTQAGASAVLALPADVTDAPAITAAVARVEQELGPIDLLVHSAGVFQTFGPFVTADPDAWWREVEINLRGTHLCLRAVLPAMVARGRGRAIALASMAGLLALPTVSAYCTSKAALIRLVECIAVETQGTGVSIFAVHPGTVATPMSLRAAESEIASRDAPLVQGYFQELLANDAFTPVDKAMALLHAVAGGKLDALSGCFIDVDEDLDELAASAAMLREQDHLHLRLSGR